MRENGVLQLTRPHNARCILLQLCLSEVAGSTCTLFECLTVEAANHFDNAANYTSGVNKHTNIGKCHIIFSVIGTISAFPPCCCILTFLLCHRQAAIHLGPEVPDGARDIHTEMPTRSPSLHLRARFCASFDRLWGGRSFFYACLKGFTSTGAESFGVSGGVQEEGVLP